MDWFYFLYFTSPPPIFQLKFYLRAAWRFFVLASLFELHLYLPGSSPHHLSQFQGTDPVISSKPTRLALAR